MKKAELMQYGIPEAKIRAFNEVYWNDVRKQAARMVEEAKGQDAAPSTASMCEAIAAMVRVIPDPVRLSMILNNVNRHYQNYTNEQNGVNGGKNDGKQDSENAPTANAQKQPETAQEGAKAAAAPLSRAERHFNLPGAVEASAAPVEAVQAMAQDAPKMAQEGASECQ